MIPEEHVKNVCKVGKGAECCRYITMGADGWSCEKLTSLAAVIDKRAATMNAKGDNCAGILNLTQ